MDAELYSIFPQVVLTGSPVELTIKGVMPQSDLRTLPAGVHLQFIGADGLFHNGELPGYTCGNGFTFGRIAFEELPIPEIDPQDGCLRITHNFHCHGEHSFRLMLGDDVLAIFRVFSVPEAWLKLRPFKGDMHLHSGYSGCCKERLRLSPEYYAAANCSRGMDFVGISDHKQFQPSLKAMDFVRQCNCDFQAYPCEEVHMPDLHNLHILNFCGKTSISDMMREPDDNYRREIAEILTHVPENLDSWVRHLMAHQEWIHKTIVKQGGLSVFCHPYWRPYERYFIPQILLEYTMEHEFFDAIELPAATMMREGNDIAAAMHTEYCMKKGHYIPVVGNNDAHSIDHCAVNYSIILAESNSAEALMAAVRAGNSVGVSDFEGEFPRCIGKLELVKYFHFLRRNYYPRHDRFARREGELLFAALATGSVDQTYVDFLKVEYKNRHDQPQLPPPVKFAPDKAAFAAVKAERAAFEAKFFQQ